MYHAFHAPAREDAVRDLLASLSKTTGEEAVVERRETAGLKNFLVIRIGDGSDVTEEVAKRKDYCGVRWG